MAQTNMADVATLIPEVISARSFETTRDTVVISAKAEQNTDLEGAPGDRVTVGTWGAVDAASNLGETDTIVPKKMAATGASFIVQRVGDGRAYSYMANRTASADLERRAGTELGQAVAYRIDTNLALSAYNARVAGRTVDASAAATDADLVKAFIDVVDSLDPVGGENANLTAILPKSTIQRIAREVGLNAQKYGDAGVWAQGKLSRFWGVDFTKSGRLAVPAANQRAGLIVEDGVTLVSAYSMRPLTEVERKPASASVEVYVNAIWAGGVQDNQGLGVLLVGAL